MRTVADVVATHWGIRDAQVESLTGGMNSATWSVRGADQRWVAKAVPVGTFARPFRYGLSLAARLEQAGIPAGAPVAALDGELIVTVAGQVFALLRWVEGVELIGVRADEFALMGDTLGRIHRILGTVEPGTGLDPRDDAAPGALDLRPWIRPAVAAAVHGVEDLKPETLTWGPVHGDPAPEHFRRDPGTGRCGLIDWGSAVQWPLMYDVATAVMYAGGPQTGQPLLEAYQAHDVLDPREIDRALVAMLRLRYAIHAIYFAGRIIAGDLTGVDGPSSNERGLADARRRLS